MPNRLLTMSARRRSGPNSTTSSSQTGLRQTVHRQLRLGRSALVILAHSDERIRTCLAESLRQMGCKVLESNDGLRLVEWLADMLLAGAQYVQPDLVVADGELPGRRGAQLLADLRAAGWRTPFILVGVEADEAARSNAAGEGRVYLFDREFETDDLLTAACAMLELAYREANERE